MLAVAAMVFLSGVTVGYRWHKAGSDAAEIKRMADSDRRLRAEIARGNDLSARLAAAESDIKTRTVEVIKHVPSVTTGRRCLDIAAVRLLQPGSGNGIKPPAGTSVAESTGAFASDTDVGYWIAGANDGYDTCAERLNALVDFYGEGLNR